MKRLLLVVLAAAALLLPTLAFAQGVSLVYRHELRGMVPVPAPHAPTDIRVVAARETIRKSF
jgi:hypothetical protein